MIELKHLSKIYDAGTPAAVTALEDISLTIRDGEIFGIIGLSGAGKSTLVRCINLLETPTSGQVVLDGQELTALSKKELLRARRSVGMIFQDFNLLEQRTILRNVLFPLELAGTPKAAAKPRALELLQGQAFTDPPGMTAGLVPELLAFARRLLGRADVPQTFVLNALVPVDFALWQLWNAKRGNGTFDALCASFCPELSAIFLRTVSTRSCISVAAALVKVMISRRAAAMRRATSPILS